MSLRHMLKKQGMNEHFLKFIQAMFDSDQAPVGYVRHLSEPETFELIDPDADIDSFQYKSLNWGHTDSN